MDFQPVSVSDDNYTLTVTSTVADKGTLFYTLTIEAHSGQAWEALELQKRESFYDLFSVRSHGSISIGGEIDPELRTFYVSICTSRGWGSSAGIRLNLMNKGKWLSFSYRPVSDLKLDINAEGQGTGGWAWPELTGPVTLERLTLSPLTLEAEYTTGDTKLFPTLWFLWKDGTVSDQDALRSGTGHGGWHGVNGVTNMTMSYSLRLVPKEPAQGEQPRHDEEGGQDAHQHHPQRRVIAQLALPAHGQVMQGVHQGDDQDVHRPAAAQAGGQRPLRGLIPLR